MGPGVFKDLGGGALAGQGQVGGSHRVEMGSCSWDTEWSVPGECHGVGFLGWGRGGRRLE